MSKLLKHIAKQIEEAQLKTQSLGMRPSSGDIQDDIEYLEAQRVALQLQQEYKEADATIGAAIEETEEFLIRRKRLKEGEAAIKRREAAISEASAAVSKPFTRGPSDPILERMINQANEERQSHLNGQSDWLKKHAEETILTGSSAVVILSSIDGGHFDFHHINNESMMKVERDKVDTCASPCTNTGNDSQTLTESTEEREAFELMTKNQEVEALSEIFDKARGHDSLLSQSDMVKFLHNHGCRVVK